MQPLFISFLIGSCLLFSASTRAQEAFIPQTQDIPLMKGLSVDVSDDMNFDTPAGQLITFEANAARHTGKEVLTYYRDTLPKMGWKENKLNCYTRDKDSVTITVIREKKPAVIRLEIVLSNPN